MMPDYKKSEHRHKLAEGILWDHRSELLLFVDIISKKLFRMDIDSFKIVDEYLFNEYIGWVQITDDPECYLIGLKSGLAILNIKTEEIKFINKEIPEYTNQRLNDSFIDTNGQLWYGSMECESIELYNGVLARFSSKKKIEIIDREYGITNGPIIDEKNNYLYHNDSKKGVVYKYELDSGKNKILSKNIFLQFDSLSMTPDGMCFDKKGTLLIAIWGGSSVNEYDQSGKCIYSYKLPEKFITNVCLGGENLDRMFVTTARTNDYKGSGGHIYEIFNHDCKGIKTNKFLIQS